jgi:diguanylate cyclase (GGDEF)-like protein
VVLLVLQGVLIYDGISRLQSIGASFREVVTQALPAEQHARSMASAAQNRIILMLRMLAEPDPFERETDARDFAEEGLAFGRSRDALSELTLDETAQSMVAEVREHAIELSQRQRTVVEALLGGADMQARQIIESEQVLEKQRALVAALNDLAHHQQSLAAHAQSQAQLEQRRAQTLLKGLGAGVFSFGLLIGLLVTRMISRAETVLRDERARAEQAAHIDPLTALYNRRGFDRGRIRWQAEAKPGQRHGLLLIDLDRFKPVNDEAGHDAGDALLKRLADLMRDHTRPHDLVARLGGDEFGVLLFGLPREEAGVIAERIRRAIDGFTFDWQGRKFHIGASIGVADFPANLPEAAWHDIMKRADVACYMAKNRGRNQVVLSGESDVPEPPAQQ